MRVWCILCLLTFSFASQAQEEKKDKWLRAGLNMAFSNTDLGAYDSYGGYGTIGLQFNKKKRLNGAFLAGFGSIDGNDPNFTTNVTGESPNRFFKTSFFFVNYDLHYNFLKTEKYQLYVSQGFGFMRFTPKDQFGEELTNQIDTRAQDETYRNLALILPTKLGGMYILPNQFGVGIEVGFLGTMTDYLDNISEFGESGNDNILSVNLNLFVPLYTE